MANEHAGQAGCGTGDGVPSSPACSVTFSKGPHRWAFACDPGSEPELMRCVNGLARRRDVPLDLFDAALIVHQIAKRLRPGLNRVPGSADGPST